MILNLVAGSGVNLVQATTNLNVAVTNIFNGTDFIYVSATIGNDSKADGSAQRPYQTVGAALPHAGDHVPIFVARGTYNDPVTRVGLSAGIGERWVILDWQAKVCIAATNGIVKVFGNGIVGAIAANPAINSKNGNIYIESYQVTDNIMCFGTNNLYHVKTRYWQAGFDTSLNQNDLVTNQLAVQAYFVGDQLNMTQGSNDIVEIYTDQMVMGDSADSGGHILLCAQFMTGTFPFSFEPPYVEVYAPQAADFTPLNGTTGTTIVWHGTSVLTLPTGITNSGLYCTPATNVIFKSYTQYNWPPL